MDTCNYHQFVSFGERLWGEATAERERVFNFCPGGTKL